MTNELTDERLWEIAGVYCLECADEPSVEPTCEHALAREARRLREEVARLRRERDEAREEIGIWSRTRAADVALHIKHRARVSALEAALRRVEENPSEARRIARAALAPAEERASEEER